MLIKAVVWDMGGVLVSEDPPLSRHAWETKLGLDSGELARMVFYHPVTLDLFHGRARPDDLSRGIERELGVPVGSLAALTSDFWGTPCWREDVFAFINERLLRGICG